MNKTAFNAQLVITGLKRVVYHFKSVDCGKSDVWKCVGLVANEENEQLDFAAC